jgi:methionine sulfoxide reductase heme-binding subunit
MTTATAWRRLAKPLVFAACLLPAASLAWRAATGELGANPISEITHRTGDWTLRFVLITLAVTPLRRLSGRASLATLRRMVGLFAFFYASLHFLTYVVLDQFFDLPGIVRDIVRRPYITAGLIGLLSMIPLALTSTAASMRRLGERTWQRLHRLVYLTAVAGVVHYWWSVKADTRLPAIYAGITAVLLGIRAGIALAGRRRRGPIDGGVGSDLGVSRLSD